MTCNHASRPLRRGAREGNGGRRPAFAPAEYFRYRHLMSAIRDVVDAQIPPGRPWRS